MLWIKKQRKSYANNKENSSNVTTIIVSHSDKPLGFCNKVLKLKIKKSIL